MYNIPLKQRVIAGLQYSPFGDGFGNLGKNGVERAGWCVGAHLSRDAVESFVTRSPDAGREIIFDFQRRQQSFFRKRPLHPGVIWLQPGYNRVPE